MAESGYARLLKSRPAEAGCGFDSHPGHQQTEIMSKDTSLRTTFNNEAELYHIVRPRYPGELFDALIKTAQLRSHAKLLEIGPGTGQATEPLARRGYEIIAIELGVDLAEVARRALAKYENVEIITGAFEDVDLPRGSFDLVYAATAFHWVESETRFTKPHELLKADGHLAIIGTNHVSDEAGDEFVIASQPIYGRYGPSDDDFRLRRIAESKADKVDEDLFAPVFFHPFPLSVRYSAEEYAQLLNTYSPTISMEPKERAAFLADIQELIEARFDGYIVKHFAMTLTMAKKKG